MIKYPSDGSAGRGSTNQLGVAVASDDHDTLPHPNNSQGSPLERGPGQFVFAGGSRPLSGYTIKRGVGAGGVRRDLLRRERRGQRGGVEVDSTPSRRRTPRYSPVPESEASESPFPVRRASGRPGQLVGGDGICFRPEPAGGSGRSSRGDAHRSSIGVDSRDRGGRGLSARPGDRSPRPETGQHLLRRRG